MTRSNRAFRKLWAVKWRGIHTRDCGTELVEADNRHQARRLFETWHGCCRRFLSVSEVKQATGERK